MPRHPAGPTKHSTCIFFSRELSFLSELRLPFELNNGGSIPSHPLSILSFLLFLFSTSSASTIYEILTQYGLPQGLLPDAVKEYSLSSDGDFVVELLKPCYVYFSTLAYYKKTITGKLEHGQISGLSGIRLRKFFVWVLVDGIIAYPNECYLKFTLGALYEFHLVSEFAEIRLCKSMAGTSCRGAESLSHL